MKTQAKERKPDKKNARRGDTTTEKRRSKVHAVDKMIQRFEKRMDDKELDVTVSEYIRLMQYRKELDLEDPKEIKVTWVEPSEKESGTET